LTNGSKAILVKSKHTKEEVGPEGRVLAEGRHPKIDQSITALQEIKEEEICWGVPEQRED
jgi:hypothetical protein